MTTEAKKAEAPRAADQEYEFVLTLDGVSELTQEAVDALFEAGCDDGTIAMRWGRAIIDFTRTAPSLAAAVESAIADVERAGIGATVIGVDPDPEVTQAEIARRAGRTRANLSQLIQGARGPGQFPPPIAGVSSPSPRWSWAAVAAWLHNAGVVDQETARQAADLAAIHMQLMRKHPPHPVYTVMHAEPVTPPTQAPAKGQAKR